MADRLQKLALPAMMSLTLGLAPFVPEPHIVGKLRWLAGGAVGMGPQDWFDLLLHGAPWVFLIVRTVQVFVLEPRAERAKKAAKATTEAAKKAS